MRKMFWCSCFGIVAAAVGVYLASHHDHHHMIRTMVHRAGQAATEQVGGAALAVSAGESWPAWHDEHCEAVPPQIIDVSMPRIIINEEEEAAATSIVVPACLEECEVMPMPPCRDEEPDEMPKVDEDSCPMAEFWMNLFRDLMKDKEAAQPAVEESDAVDEGEPADCQEDKDYHHRYPGCPYMGGCPRSSPCTPTVPEMKDQEVIDPVPAEEITEPRPVPTDEAPTHPDVDTMEFRPSDALPKENDPQQIG